MADIVIRDLDDSVVARLEARARETNQSLEEVVRSILRNAAQPSQDEAAARAAAIRDSIRARTGGDVPLDATALIREDRNRFWAAIDAHRRKIGPVQPDAIVLLREDRD